MPKETGPLPRYIALVFNLPRHHRRSKSITIDDDLLRLILKYSDLHKLSTTQAVERLLWEALAEHKSRPDNWAHSNLQELKALSKDYY